jgi:hypothetical protein
LKTGERTSKTQPLTRFAHKKLPQLVVYVQLSDADGVSARTCHKIGALEDGCRRFRSFAQVLSNAL